MRLHFKKPGITAVTDMPYGDCGKGRVVSYVLREYSRHLIGKTPLVVVRWQGSSNSGHTVPFGDKLVDVHALPSGLIPVDDRHIMNVMAGGMAFSLPRFFEEIAHLKSFGIEVSPDNLLVSEAAQVILPYHRALDTARESGGNKSGTTKQGVAFAYGLATMYEGIRFGDLFDMKYVKKKLATPLGFANCILKGHYGLEEITEQEVLEEIEDYREGILPFLGDDRQFLNQALTNGARIIAEGAQSLGLDKDQGLYPHITGSNTLVGSLQSSAGIHPEWLDESFLVFKAYDTSVGERPLIGQMPPEIEKVVQERGGEKGVTSGRVRQCLYPSLPWGKVARDVVRPTHLVINKGDVLTGLPMQICTGFELDGQRIDYIPRSTVKFRKCKPILEEQQSWTQDFQGATHIKDLPGEFCHFLDKLVSPFAGPTKLALVGTGPYQDDMVVY